VQASGDAMNGGIPETCVQSRHERVTPTPVHGTRAAEMPVQFSSIQEIGEGQLLEGRRAAVSVQLRPPTDVYTSAKASCWNEDIYDVGPVSVAENFIN
jgi:hypothetical protein